MIYTCFADGTPFEKEFLRLYSNFLMCFYAFTMTCMYIYVAYSRPNDWTDWGIYLAKKTKILFYYFFIPRATPGSSASSLHSREFNHPQQAILGIFQLWRGGGGVMINKYSPHPGKHLVPSLNMF